MPRLIAAPTVVAAAGNKPKRIEEYAGRVNSGHSAVSVARMVSPGGWVEPGQRPEFEEITVVLRGTLRVEHDGGVLDVRSGSGRRDGVRRVGALLDAGRGGAEYVAVCLPAFSPATSPGRVIEVQSAKCEMRSGEVRSLYDLIHLRIPLPACCSTLSTRLPSPPRSATRRR